MFGVLVGGVVLLEAILHLLIVYVFLVFGFFLCCRYIVDWWFIFWCFSNSGCFYPYARKNVEWNHIWLKFSTLKNCLNLLGKFWTAKLTAQDRSKFQKVLNLEILFRVLILKGKMVGLGGLEPPTSPLSGLCVILFNAFNMWVCEEFLWNLPNSSHKFLLYLLKIIKIDM